MTPWVIAVWLYAVGLVGFYATACDLNRRHPGWGTRLNVIFWPVTIALAAVGDAYDWLTDGGPGWLKPQNDRRGRL